MTYEQDRLHFILWTSFVFLLYYRCYYVCRHPLIKSAACIPVENSHWVEWYLKYIIVSPDKVGDTLDAGQSRHRHRRTDFLRRAMIKKLFILGLSNLVCGFLWGRTPCLLFCGLGLQKIGQWRPLKGPNLGFLVYFGPVLNSKKADGLK